MPLHLLLALQAAAPAPAEVARIDFDLAEHRREQAGMGGLASRCGPRGEGSEIVVCGRVGAGAYPLEKMARIFEQGPLDAEATLAGNVRGRAFVESAAMPDGRIAKRVMVGIKVPF